MSEEEDSEDEVNPEEAVTEVVKKVRKAGYKTQKFVITCDNVNDFKILENRRQICDTHVGKIHRALIDGKNPIGTLIVNKKLEDMRLIDGNHRLEALKRFFEYKKAYSQVKVECILKVYENLSEDEERAVYTDEARRRNESHEDRLNMFKDKIMMWKLINDKTQIPLFPCKVNIYASKDGVRLRVILNALHSYNCSSAFGYNPSPVKKDELIPFCEELTHDDYLLVKKFITFFVDTFGEVSMNNMFARAHFFTPLFDLYARNRELEDTASFKERFRRIIGKPEMITYFNVAGKEAQIRIRKAMLEYMNSGFSRNQFV
jgi:hypothetical protein